MIAFFIDIVVQNTLLSFLACGVVLVLARIFRTRPALIHFAGVLALIALFLPTLVWVPLPSPFADALQSAFRWESQREPNPQDFAANLASDAAIPNRSIMTDTVVSSSHVDSRPLHSNLQTSLYERNANDLGAKDFWAKMKSFDVRLIGLMLWGIGGGVYVCLTARQVFRFRRLLSILKPARVEVGSLIDAESRKIGLRRSPLAFEIDAIASPFVYQTWHGPRLVVPSKLVDSISKDELGSLVCHELAHVKRHDPIVRYFETLVTAIYWFNPAVWIIRRQLRKTEELSCDAYAVDSLDGKPEIYAGAFLKTIHFLSTKPTIDPPGLACTVGSYRFCRQRLQSMVTATNHVGLSRVHALASIVLFFPLSITSVQMVASQESVESTGPSQEPGIDLVHKNMVTASGPILTATDYLAMEQLDAIKETPHIVFHYRASDLDEAALKKVVSINQQKFSECEEQLKMKYQGQVHIFLYRNIDDLQRIHGTDAVAFATGRVSIHQPIDFQSVHELTHIFAVQFPSDDDAATDAFVTEGLATILAKSDQGIPIHAWASTYHSKHQLNGLVEFRRVWPNGALPRVHPYHVAGSFVGYLIEKYGIEKVKRWYVHSTEAHMEFGKSFPRLEKEWLLWLETYEVQPEHRQQVLAKLHLIPDEYAKAKKVPVFNGKSLEGLTSPDQISNWKAENGRLFGTDKTGAWTFLYSEQSFPKNTGASLKFRLVDGKAITLQINRDGKQSNHVNLATWATYVAVKDGGYVGLQNLRIKPGQWYEVVIVNNNGTARLYLDGLEIGAYDDVFRLNKGQVGIGVEAGTIEVTELVAFEHEPVE